jgi:hypothetical protein
MRYPRVIALAAAVVIGLGSPSLVVGQAAKDRPKANLDAPPIDQAYRPPVKKQPPRTVDGQPNIQGIWSQTGTYTPLQRPKELADKPFYTQKEAEELYQKMSTEIYQDDPGLHYKFTQYGTDRWQTGLAMNLRTSIITDPSDGRLPPLTEEAKKRDNRGSMRNFPELSLHTRCVTGYWTGGGPMLRAVREGEVDPNGDNGAQGETEILQTKDYVVIVQDSDNDTRIIPLDNRSRLAPTTTKWFGDSRGHWEGSTLVVETTNFNDDARVVGQKIRNMKMTERFMKKDDNTLLYQFTVDDPATWTKPWSGEVPWPRVEGPMFEAACTEENFSLVQLLKSTLFTREQARKKASGSTK